MITRVVEKPGSRRSSFNKTGREYSYVLTLVSNNGKEDENSLLLASRVNTGAPYVNRSFIDATAGCLGVEFERIDKTVWEGTVRYSSEKKSASGGKSPKEQNHDKPLMWPTEIHWSGRMIETYGNYDVKGKPFVNTVGDALKDRPPAELWHAVVSLTRYESKYNPVYASKFAGKINSNMWFACPMYTAKCGWPEAVLTWVDAAERYYWKVTYNFEIAPEGWRPSRKDHPLLVANRGRRCRLSPSQGGDASDSNKLFLTKDANGVATGDEAFLDSAGYQLTPRLSEESPTNPHMLVFTFYDTIDFNALKLP